MPKGLLNYYRFTELDQKRHPFVSRVLSGLSSNKIKKELEEIGQTKLTKKISSWVSDYNSVGKRTIFVWQWISFVVPLITLKEIDSEDRDSVIETKIYILSLITYFLNDIADNLKSKKLLMAVSTIFLGNHSSIKIESFNREERKIVSLAKKHWLKAITMIKEYPLHKDFEDIFQYDLLKVISANLHDYLSVKEKFFLNEDELYSITPYTIAAMPCLDIDLMTCPRFNKEELGLLREFILNYQKAMRLSNWLATWEREIIEGDFTSLVVQRSLNKKIITDKEISTKKKLAIGKIKKSDIEKEILKEWDGYYKEINSSTKKIKSLDLAHFVESLEKIISLELASKGYR